MTFAGVAAAVGVHFSFFGEHLPERIAINSPNVTRSKNKTTPKYQFYDALRQRESELASDRDLTAATEGDTTADKRYVVQIGAFKTSGDARRTKKRAEKFGYPVKVVKRGTNFLVQAGPFFGKKTTNSAKSKLARNNFPTLIKLVKP